MSFTSDIKNEIMVLAEEQDEKKAFLREVFLLNGSVINPEKEYHLEILTDDEEMAEEICKTLEFYGISAKIIEKKYKYAVYVKEAESIALFLNIIGAHHALFHFENAKVMHEMNNQINRMVNCETANLSKIVNTAVRQIEAINKIKDSVGLEALPENLREIALLRLENPEAGLAELGEMLQVPVGKSGVNHRLKKIEEIAEKLSMETKK